MADTKCDQDLAALQSEYKDFAYKVSHDLAAPLRAVVEFSKLLKAEHGAVLNDEAQQYLSLIVDGGSKMQKLLAALLEYSRAQTLPLDIKPTDANAVMAACQAKLSDRLAKAKIAVGKLPTVKADADKLDQIFTLLLDNALLFQKPGNVPEITVTAAGNAISFKDNGIGIDAGYYDVIFQVFKRMHSDSEYPGIGMGLTIARKLAQRMGGDITVQSASGAGATFTLQLPG